MITEAPEGMYYRSAQEVSEYNLRVVEYNRQVREYKKAQREAARPEPPREQKMDLRETSAPGLLWYGHEPEILVKTEGDEVRRVEASQNPIQPFIEDLSPAGPEGHVPADTKPIYGEGREPTLGEQLLGVARVPATVLRATGEAVGTIRERLPSGRGDTLKFWLAAPEGFALGASALVDPATFLGLPGALQEAGRYISSRSWAEVGADIKRGGVEYAESRIAQPELAMRDVAYQLGAAYGFKAVTGLSGRALRATGEALGGLPGDTLGAEGLATIGGESSVPFKQAYQVLRQRGGLGSDILGAEGLAVTGDLGLPLRQTAEVIWQRGSLGSDVLGTQGLARISGGAPYPLRQGLEVWAQRAALRNLPGEALGGGLAAFGGDPAFMPLKQLVEVVRQRGRLGSDTMGATGMGTQGTSVKAFFKFLGMPGAVEPYSRVPYTPKSTAGDISGFLKIVADEQAARNAGRMEGFMKSTFTEQPVPVRGAPDTSAAQLIQMRSRGSAGPWGFGAVDVFPFEVLSYPSGEELISRERMREVERHDQPPRQEKAFRQDLGDQLGLKDLQIPRLQADQLPALKQEPQLKNMPRMRQPLGARQASLQLPGLKNFLVQQQEQRQQQRMAAPGYFDMKPGGRRFRLPHEGSGLELPSGRRRRYKGERRTYPVRDPEDVLSDFLMPGKARRRKR